MVSRLSYKNSVVLWLKALKEKQFLSRFSGEIFKLYVITFSVRETIDCYGPEKCQIADYMKECGADYLVLGGCFAVKDTGDYVEGWNVDQGRNATWIYQTTSALQG